MQNGHYAEPTDRGKVSDKLTYSDNIIICIIYVYLLLSMYISVLKYSNNWHDIFPEELRQIGKRQAKDIMDEQHYCMDEANVKCYIDETEERSEWRVIICVQWTLGSRKTERRRRRIRSCLSVCLGEMIFGFISFHLQSY